MHVDINYQLVHIQLPIKIKDVISSKKKKMTLYNAMIKVRIYCRAMDLHMYIRVLLAIILSYHLVYC